MATLSTHVLDTGAGRPAIGVPVVLESANGETLAEAYTDSDGRVGSLVEELAPGDYRLRFDTGTWFSDAGVEGFYPEVAVAFTIAVDEHFHVPLLLSRYGYSTYRGS
ncbi:MAG: hydroxyisourate hydrolase [Nocardioides sp.]|jgi:5-hydroxyisourate hydrolase